MRFRVVSLLLISLSFCASSFAVAQTLPGPADVGRIKPDEKLVVPDRGQDQRVAIPSIVPSEPVPKGAREFHFVLRKVRIEGMTAFAPQQMANVYATYIGKDVSLDVAWKIVAGITNRYREAGYFLSRAYAPEQEIRGGCITVRVAEGVIGKVDLPDEVKSSRVVKKYVDRLLSEKPVTTDEVESFLLRLNDLPGYSFRGVLSPVDHEAVKDAAANLTLMAASKEGRGSITFDNYSSRYMDPNEVTVSYSASLLPLQQTTVSGLSNLPGDKLHYGTLNHTMAIAPDTKLEFNGGVIKAYPGYTLEREDINSQSVSESVALEYQWVRQRQENLALRLMLEKRDVTSDALNTPLTRDHIHAVRAGAVYDRSDGWDGYNILSTTLSQGIDGFGSSQKGDRNLSRAGAAPDFTKAEWSLSRLQAITGDWSLLAATSGQWASGVLYSSEQFGYGGQSFGRAYDASDITGDNGISGSLELRYGGIPTWDFMNILPYAFYDIGEVWNGAVGQPKSESGASVGAGVRFTTAWQESGNLGLAWPLTRSITAPVYGGSTNGPRFLLQIGQQF